VGCWDRKHASVCFYGMWGLSVSYVLHAAVGGRTDRFWHFISHRYQIVLL
jgi:hypothetical protein